MSIVVLLVALSVFTTCKKDDSGKKDDGEQTNDISTEAPKDEPDIKEGILTFKEGEGAEFDQYSPISLIHLCHRCHKHMKHG